MSATFRYRPIEERELAKDFGFDVTAPSGGVQTSGANNREYKTECRKIYSEFLMNMRDYIFQEEQIKKELTKLRSQTASSHKQARDPVISLSSRCSSTRRDSLYSNDTSLQSEVLKPGRINLSKKRPKTVIGTIRGRDVNLDQVDSRDDSILPDIITTHGGTTSTTTNLTARPSTTVNTKPTSPRDRENHNAIVESNSDFACSRVIKMNPRAYSKLVCGKANVHVLNRSSGYLLKPVSETKTDVLMPKNVGRSNCPERLAIVRERTNFRSPTLSNDLKVNNILAIKKSLVGDTSPRLTVGDVMNSARERRSRLYRIQLTSDVIENSKGEIQRSPRVSSYSKSKTPCLSPPTARLTRKNLARFEQDIQKEAIKKLRKTVVDMVSSVENKGEEVKNIDEKHSNFSPRRYEEHLEDIISEDAFVYSQQTPRNHEQDAICDSSDQRLKFNNSLRRMSRVSYLETVTKIDSRRGSTNLERIKDGSRTRLRSEMSTRPSTMHSGFCSENSSPRKVSHQETIALVKQSKTEDDFRDNELNLWRQRMIFAVGKKDQPVSKI